MFSIADYIKQHSSSYVWLMILIGLVWVPAFGRLFNALVLRIPTISVVGPEMQHIVTGLSAVFAWNCIKKNLRKSDVIFFVSFVSFYLFSFILYTENSFYLALYVIDVFVLALPAYFVGLVWNVNKMDNYLYILSILMIAYTVLMKLISIENTSNNYDEQNYQMGAAYELLPHLCYVTWHLLRKYSFLSLSFTIFGLILLLSYGTRGPIVCWFSLIIFYFLFVSQSKKFFSLVGLLFIWVVFNYWDSILLFFDNFFPTIHASNRILNQVMSETVLDDSGRGSIYSVLSNQLQFSPLTGYGLFGSFRFVSNYAHNLYMDFCFSFGYFAGILLLFILSILIISAFLKAKDNVAKGFLLLLVSITIVQLFMSNSWLFSPFFFLMLGYCVRVIRISRNVYKAV